MNKTSIEWTNYTWNTTFGCTRVSDGCRNCYAEALALRFGHSKHPWTKPFETENVQLKPHKLREPFSIKEPAFVFVDSMSDLFHPLVPDSHIFEVWNTMRATPHLTYQILTKRPERMMRVLQTLSWSSDPEGRRHGFLAYEGPPGAYVLPNVWLGTSVEDQRVTDRIDWLLKTPAAVRFLSVEPMIGPVDLWPWLEHAGPPWPDESWRPRLHWVITGGESGPHHRPFDPQWARAIRDQCVEVGIPFFFKQHGGRTPKSGGRLLDGREWNEMPEPRIAERQLSLLGAA